eukprot:10122572-Heterocapsa_arctica.AAC.1
MSKDPAKQPSGSPGAIGGKTPQVGIGSSQRRAELPVRTNRRATSRGLLLQLASAGGGPPGAGIAS